MNLNPEEIAWKLFEFAEGNLQGEEQEFWAQAIDKDPEIKAQYLDFCQTYLTGKFTAINPTYTTPAPLANLGEDLTFAKKSSLKRVSMGKATLPPQSRPAVHRNFNPTTEILYPWPVWVNNRYAKAITTAAAIIVLGFFFWNPFSTSFQEPYLTQNPASTTSPINNKTNHPSLASNQPSNEATTLDAHNQSNPLNHKIHPTKNSNSPIQEAEKSTIHKTSTLASIHPLIAATENYHSKPTHIENEIYCSKGISNPAIASVSIDLDLQGLTTSHQVSSPKIEETIIKIVKTEPASVANKRKFIAHNVKEMMRKGQLPDIKIQTLNEPKVGVLPAFRLELDVNQVPVYQTSNR